MEEEKKESENSFVNSITSSLEQDDNDDKKVEEALNDYYRLKNKYDEKKRLINNAVRVKYSKLSKKTLKQKYLSQKYPCVNCGRKVNVLFQETEYKLLCKCGDSNSPCKLHIEIEKAKYLPFNDILNGSTTQEGINEKREKIKDKIINLKLKLIFKLMDESLALEVFEKEKEEYSDTNEILLFYKSLYHEIVNSKINEKLTENEELFSEHISNFKKSIHEYEETNNTVKLRDAFAIIKHDINPLNEKINNDKYFHRYIENIYHNDILSGCKLHKSELPALYDTEMVYEGEWKLISHKLN
jgi:hypothetical protein